MFSKINEALRALMVRFDDAKGQALAEYGLIIGLIAVVCIVALGVLGVALNDKLDFINGELGAS